MACSFVSRSVLRGLIHPRRHTYRIARSFVSNDETAAQYWNREEFQGSSDKKNLSADNLVKEARILSLSDPNDGANVALTSLPPGARIVGTGTTLEEVSSSEVTNKEGQTPNVVFVSPSCPAARVELCRVLDAYHDSIEWVHVRSAGIDFVVSDELARLTSPSQKNTKNIKVTNAKGQFSSTLAEYTMMACSYFAKDLPRLLRQKSSKTWEKYDVEELRGKTMGIVGYGDIGRACAKLAHVYGMRIVALRRNPLLSKNDPLCKAVYGTDRASLHRLLGESDYVVCSAPSTVETHRMLDAASFASMKRGSVFINLGRGPVVDEEALVESLTNGSLKGAALDVFVEEPLPKEHPLWNVDNVLISPHNMDQTQTFMHEATEFFVHENLPRFLCGEELLNPVDTVLGY